MTEFEKLVRILIDSIASDFGSTLKTRIDALNRELGDIKQKKETNKEILENINEASQKKKDISVELDQIHDFLANLL